MGSVLGAGLGGLATWLLARRQAGGASGPSGPGAEDVLGHETLKFGVPISDRIRAHTNFVLSYDSRLRQPRWVVEHLTKDKLKGEGSRGGSQFFEDAAIPARFRAKLSDYRASGLDRGHMAPASNHKASQQTMNETFSLSNMCPQVGDGFNRDYWARLERFAQQATREFDDVWIVTGPLYLPRPASAAGRGGGSAALRLPGNPGAVDWVLEHGMLGSPPELVGVPTHFFKIVLGERRDGAIAGSLGGGKARALGAFVLPNAPVAPDHPLTAFSVPLTALEAVSGVEFFPHLVDDERRRELDAESLLWQARGKAEAVRVKGAFAAHPPLLLPQPTAPTDAGNGGGRGRPRKVHADSEATASASSAAAPSSAPYPGPIRHLCQEVDCRLPAEEFWKKGDKKVQPPLLPPPQAK